MKRIYLTKELFIEKSNILYNNKYNFELISDFKSTVNVKIICPIHGVFEQKPHDHLKGYGCPECFKDSQKKSHNDFVLELKLIRPNLIVIGNYINNYTKILVMDENNFKYLCSPASLIKNHPSIKTCLDKNMYFVNKANIIHNNKYDYSLSNYDKANNKIKIICPIHGTFEQNPSNHLSGQGCPKCNKVTVYDKHSWINHCANNKYKSFVYIIKCYNDSEEFIKIGITSRTLNKRFHNKKEMPYNYEIIKIIEGTPEYIFNKESELHGKLISHKYIPKIKFNGMYECFSVDVLNIIIF